MKNKLREKRKERGLTQLQLAEKAGVARTIITQVETGSRDVITSGTMLKLANALETSVASIFFVE